MGSRLRGNDAAARLNTPVHAGGNIGVIQFRNDPPCTAYWGAQVARMEYCAYRCL